MKAVLFALRLNELLGGGQLIQMPQVGSTPYPNPGVHLITGA
jgi:hypothetical protein